MVKVKTSMLIFIVASFFFFLFFFAFFLFPSQSPVMHIEIFVKDESGTTRTSTEILKFHINVYDD